MQLRSNVTPLHRDDWPRGASLEASVRQHLASLFASQHFDASSRSRDFLRYVVDEGLAGRGAALNQAAIAMSVFARKADFDPLLDPIVRVQAGRLRRSLERYYLLTTERHALRIELPKGSYAPVFKHRLAPARESEAVAAAPPVAVTAISAALLVHPFEISCVLDDELAAQLAEELTLELHRYGNVHILRQRDLDRLELEPRDGLQFELCGRVRRRGTRLLISARIVDRFSAEQVWGDELTVEAQPDGWSDAADAARVIAARVGGERGIVVRALAAQADPQRLARDDDDGLALRWHRYVLSGHGEDLVAAMRSAERLTARAPDNALAWMRLARLYLANHCFEISAAHTPIEAALAAGDHAVALDPTSVRSRCALAAALLVHGDIDTARHEMEQARRVSGESLAYAETLGWLAALAGEWTLGVGLIRDAMARNPFAPAHARQALWADCLRRGELDASYVAALDYHDTGSFWRELMSACSLGHLGRTAEAKAHAAQLLKLKPDFAQRAHALIARFIKFADLHERIADGLRKAGVPLGT